MPTTRHSGAPQSGEPGIHNPCAGTMDSGLLAEPVIGPATSGRTRWLGPGMTENYAAFCFAVISLRLIRHSAIWMALSAAPLRRLSETIHIASPFSTVASSRMRLI